MSLNNNENDNSFSSYKIGGNKLSPIKGKLLYAQPALVPETNAPDDIVIKRRKIEILRLNTCPSYLPVKK